MLKKIIYFEHCFQVCKLVVNSILYIPFDQLPHWLGFFLPLLFRKAVKFGMKHHCRSVDKIMTGVIST